MIRVDISCWTCKLSTAVCRRRAEFTEFKKATPREARIW